MPKIAAFGGAYANPYALDAMLVDARARGCERICSLGDLGGFGAECDAVWPLLSAHGVECVAGNYDIAIGRGDPDCGCGYSDPRDNGFAQQMYDYTRTATSAEFAAWMRGLSGELRERIGGVDVHMVHGSPLAVNDFLWESLSDDELRVRLAVSGADVLLCSHTGFRGSVASTDASSSTWAPSGGRPTTADPTPGTRCLSSRTGRSRRSLCPSPTTGGHRRPRCARRACPSPSSRRSRRAGGLRASRPSPRLSGRAGATTSTARRFRAGSRELTGQAFADAPELEEDGRPVVSLFGTAVFPSRLWIYMNFHCNLACDYCVVASSPRARRRELSLERVRALVDEAVAEGFAELYLTGGEPFVHPQIVPMLEYASDRLDTVVLTNAMLFRGRRARELERLAGRERLVLQTSLDGARPETHDRWRGTGSWLAAMQGIDHARELDLPLRVAMTETPDNTGEVGELREQLRDLGITGSDFAVRPLVARGFAEDAETGTAVSDAVMAPELTVTADGVHWHPVGADLHSSPDFLVALGTVPLAEAKRAIVERFLKLRQADGTLPPAFACAV